MNNSLLPLLSSSQFKSFGSDEMNMDTNPMVMDNIIRFYDSSFCFNYRVCNDHYEFAEIYNALPSYTETMYYEPGARVENERLVDMPLIGSMDYLPNSTYIPQQLSSINNKISVTQPTDVKTPTNTRKRTPEVGTKLANNKKFHYGHKHKKNDNIIQVNQLLEAKETLTSNRVPVKRSQRLSDKITALQKLVSPYGKTDTASVLEEASISIKLLQDQIHDLFHIRNNSDIINNQTFYLQKTQETEADLRERGLCLVPLSVAGELTKEYQF